MKKIYINSIEGVDTNDGLTGSTPIKSFKRLNEIVDNGDCIEVAGGSVFAPALKYDGEKLIIDLEKSLTSCIDNATYAFDLSSYNLTLEYDKEHSVFYEKPVLSTLAEIPTEAIQKDDSTGLSYVIIEHNHGANTYEKPANIGANARAYIAIDGTVLTMCDSLENCQATENSYYAENITEPAGDFSGGTTITTKGICKVYFNYSSDYSIVQTPCYHITFKKFYGVIKDLDIYCGSGKNGAGGIRGYLKNVEFKYGTAHSALIPYNHILGCKSDSLFCGFHSYVDSEKVSVLFENCIAKCSIDKLGIIGYYTHGNSGQPYWKSQILKYINCVAEGYETGVGNGDNDLTIIENLIVGNYITAVQVNGTRGLKAQNICAYPALLKRSAKEVLHGSILDVYNSGFNGYKVKSTNGDSIIKNCTFVARNENTEYEVDSEYTINYENCIFSETNKNTFVLGNANNKRIYKNCYFNLAGMILMKDGNLSAEDFYRIEELEQLYPGIYQNCKSNIHLIERKLTDVPQVTTGIEAEGADILNETYYTFDGTRLKLYARLPKFVRIERSGVTYYSLVVFAKDSSGVRYGGYVSSLDFFQNKNGVNKSEPLDDVFGVGVNYKIENDIMEITIDKRSTVSNVFNTKNITELYIQCNEITDNDIFDGDIGENRYRLKGSSIPYQMGAGCRL